MLFSRAVGDKVLPLVDEMSRALMIPHAFTTNKKTWYHTQASGRAKSSKLIS